MVSKTLRNIISAIALPAALLGIGRAAQAQQACVAQKPCVTQDTLVYNRGAPISPMPVYHALNGDTVRIGTLEVPKQGPFKITYSTASGKRATANNAVVSLNGIPQGIRAEGYLLIQLPTSDHSIRKSNYVRTLESMGTPLQDNVQDVTLDGKQTRAWVVPLGELYDVLSRDANQRSALHTAPLIMRRDEQDCDCASALIGEIPLVKVEEPAYETEQHVIQRDIEPNAPKASIAKVGAPRRGRVHVPSQERPSQERKRPEPRTPEPRIAEANQQPLIYLAPLYGQQRVESTANPSLVPGNPIGLRPTHSETNNHYAGASVGAFIPISSRIRFDLDGYASKVFQGEDRNSLPRNNPYGLPPKQSYSGFDADLQGQLVANLGKGWLAEGGAGVRHTETSFSPGGSNSSTQLRLNAGAGHTLGRHIELVGGGALRTDSREAAPLKKSLYAGARLNPSFQAGELQASAFYRRELGQRTNETQAGYNGLTANASILFPVSKNAGIVVGGQYLTGQGSLEGIGGRTAERTDLTNWRAYTGFQLKLK